MADDGSTRLIGQIADTALHPEAWPNVLENLSTFAGARGALLIPLSGDVGGLQVTKSLDELLHVYVEDGWCHHDFRYRGKVKMLRDGITVDQDFVDADRIRKEPFYDAFLRPLGLRFFAGLAITSGSAAWALTLQRSVSSDPFSPEEQARLQRLVAPLQDSVRIGRALRSAYVQGSVDRLSAQDVACLLFDERGRIVYLNASAERLLGDALDITHGHIKFNSRRQTSEVGRKIRMALDAPSLDRPSCSAPVLIGQPSPDYLLRVTRLPLGADTIFEPYRGMIQIRRIHRRLEADLDLLRQAYALTQRETHVLRAFVQHNSLADASRLSGISYETARSHMKSIFLKTGVSSQLELLALMANYTASSAGD